MNSSTKFQLQPPYDPLMMSKEMIFYMYFFLCKFSILIVIRLPWQPIKFSSLDKIPMYGRGLLNKHFCKTFVKMSEGR